MEEYVSFASREYSILLVILAFARGMDFLSTWMATPRLVLEGNPIAKKLGWKWGAALNLAIVFGLALMPPSAIVVSTTSLLVAARNFQSAWLMRSMGEEGYRDWYVERLRAAPPRLYLFSLVGNTALFAFLGGALVLFSNGVALTVCIGVGVLLYAVAVLGFTLLAWWRSR